MDEDEYRRNPECRKRLGASGMLARAIVLGTLLAAAATRTEAQQPVPQPMKCEAGPLTRTFGGTEWPIYGCDDQALMVIVSVPGNPAMPFYFFLKPEAGTYRIEGEGTGDKQASHAAGDSLSKLTPTEFASLLGATKGR